MISPLFLGSCSLFEDNNLGSLSFSLPSDAFYSLRAAETESLFLDISLKGEYEASRTLAVTTDMKVVFDRIPVGKKIYVEAVIYRSNPDNSNSKEVCYAGKSDYIRIGPDDNRINLRLKGAGGLSVKVNIAESQSDLTLSYSKNGALFTFTASLSNGAASSMIPSGARYIWYLDGEVQEESAASCTIDTSNMTEGIYEIEVVLDDKSAAATIEITE